MGDLPKVTEFRKYIGERASCPPPLPHQDLRRPRGTTAANFSGSVSYHDGDSGGSHMLEGYSTTELYLQLTQEHKSASHFSVGFPY